MPAKKAKAKKKAALLGLGLDAKDGHVRVTKGENFHLVGGSEETHGTMQENCPQSKQRMPARCKTAASASG